MRQFSKSTAIAILQILEDSAVPIAGIFFLSSMWYGWQLTPQLVSDLATDTFSYDSQSLNYYLNLQWKFFLLGIFSIAFFFFFRAVVLFLAEPKKQRNRALTVAGFIVAALVSVFVIQQRTYLLYFPDETIGGSEPRLSSMKPEKHSKPEISLSKEEDDLRGTESGSNLLKEAVSAFKDLNSYLMNWAILLLTGISALLVYRLNLFPRQ